jgi:hypothetical protein
VSTDADGDALQYSVVWGDGSLPLMSEYLPNGTSFNVTHQWANPGVYTILVSVSDNQTISESSLMVSIDAILVGDIGYLTDDNEDGTYDTFHSSTGVTSATEKTAQGTYLIDSDNDDDWDYIFDPQTKLLTPYTVTEGGTTPQDNTLMV